MLASLLSFAGSGRVSKDWRSSTTSSKKRVFPTSQFSVDPYSKPLLPIESCSGDPLISQSSSSAAAAVAASTSALSSTTFTSPLHWNDIPNSNQRNSEPNQSSSTNTQIVSSFQPTSLSALRNTKELDDRKLDENPMGSLFDNLKTPADCLSNSTIEKKEKLSKDKPACLTRSVGNTGNTKTIRAGKNTKNTTEDEQCAIHNQNDQHAFDSLPVKNDNQQIMRDDLLPNPLKDEDVNIYENEEEEEDDDGKSLQSLKSEKVKHERSYMGMTRSSMMINTRHTTDALYTPLYSISDHDSRCYQCKYAIRHNANMVFTCDLCSKQYHVHCIWGQFYMMEAESGRQEMALKRRKWYCATCLMHKYVEIYDWELKQ